MKLYLEVVSNIFAVRRRDENKNNGDELDTLLVVERDFPFGLERILDEKSSDINRRSPTVLLEDDPQSIRKLSSGVNPDERDDDKHRAQRIQMRK